MKVEFKNITNTTIYQSWWKEELEFEDKKGKYGIKVFGKWLLEPLFDKKIDLKDYEEEILLISNMYYAYIYKYEYNICVYLSNYSESEYFTLVNHSDYNKFGFWGVDDTEDLDAVFGNYFYVFKEGEFYGYRDYKGNIVIDPIFRNINENIVIQPYRWSDKHYIMQDKNNKWGAVKLLEVTQILDDGMSRIIGYKLETVIDFDKEEKQLVVSDLKNLENH